MWIVFAPPTALSRRKPQKYSEMYKYTTYTGTYSPNDPQFSRGVDEFPQKLSTNPIQAKKRKLRAIFSMLFAQEANAFASYPQIVQYLWITQVVARVFMKPLAYSGSSAPVCRGKRIICGGLMYGCGLLILRPAAAQPAACLVKNLHNKPSAPLFPFLCECSIMYI